ncbi:MAG: NAD-dependent epimerase/dehydratase family protein [Xanthomonadales bacterium]|nr:NAD-dependent epimerase/dehydratase family protein [Xanthomonadales bacterium]MCB1628576.1 NAD-dependent epimerase/dehydratase family protein [Xanthomonadales bacterium]
MTTLVTGAAGFIGAYTARALAERGESVIAIDSFNDYYDPQLKHDRIAALLTPLGIVVERVDVADAAAMSALFAERRPQRVVHLAAQAGVRYSLEAPRAYLRANVDGFLNILEGCREHPVEHLCFASTSSIYGDTRDIPYRESQKVQRPVSLYAATKGANELMAHAYAHLFGIPATALRFFTVYGPWGRPDMAPLLFTRAALDGRSIRVFNHGQMRRDFTHVTDIVAGILGALAHPPERSDEGAPLRVLNLGRGEPVDLLRFIELIEQAVGRPIAREYTDMQAGDMVETYADTSAAKALFGYAPAISLEQGVPPLVNWCRDYFASSSAVNAG